MVVYTCCFSNPEHKAEASSPVQGQPKLYNWMLEHQQQKRIFVSQSSGGWGTLD